MTLSEVAKRTNLSRATARRFLLTLQELGYVRADGKFFELTSKVLQLGYSYLSSATLPQLMEPVLEELSSQVHESASASVLEGSDILYIARVHTRSIMRVGISVGTRFPATNTSMGRVLLAYQAPGVLEKLLAAGVSAPTGHGIDTVEELRAELEQRAHPGIRDRGPGTRDRAALGCRAGVCIGRQCGCRDERVHERGPAVAHQCAGRRTVRLAGAAAGRPAGPGRAGREPLKRTVRVPGERG